MTKIKTSTANVGNADFDWTPYEDGWNGVTLKINKKVKTGNSRIKIYSHEPYANELHKRYLDTTTPVCKELHSDNLVKITNFSYSDGNTILADINGGATNVVIDLNKEQKFFNTMTIGNDTMTKETFLACLADPEVKAKILEMGLVAKVGPDVEKASIWEGYVDNLTYEMREQIHRKDKAYMAKIISSNNGGFVVMVADTVKAFMPGSMAAANKLTNYESLVGQTMEVMVESFDKRYGFVVSRKKFLKTITPIHLKNLAAQVEADKDAVFTGTITGSTPFGIFVELDGYSGCLTGMLHKTLISDSLRAALRENKVVPNTKLAVFVHKIEKGRIIFSDVVSGERDAIIAKREAEDAQEKNEYVAAKRDAVKISADAVNTTTVVEIPTEE